MKYIENSPLLGRKGQTLQDSNANPLCPDSIIHDVLMTGVPEQLSSPQTAFANVKKLLGILDDLEAQQAVQPLHFVTIGDTDWDWVRKILELTLVTNRGFQLHAPAVLEELDRRVNAGKTQGSAKSDPRSVQPPQPLAEQPETLDGGWDDPMGSKAQPSSPAN